MSNLSASSKHQDNSCNTSTGSLPSNLCLSVTSRILIFLFSLSQWDFVSSLCLWDGCINSSPSVQRTNLMVWWLKIPHDAGLFSFFERNKLLLALIIWAITDDVVIVLFRWWQFRWWISFSTRFARRNFSCWSRFRLEARSLEVSFIACRARFFFRGKFYPRVPLSIFRCFHRR